jgi:hypothetical protein
VKPHQPIKSFVVSPPRTIDPSIVMRHVFEFHAFSPSRVHIMAKGTACGRGQTRKQFGACILYNVLDKQSGFVWDHRLLIVITFLASLTHSLMNFAAGRPTLFSKANPSLIA